MNLRIEWLFKYCGDVNNEVTNYFGDRIKRLLPCLYVLLPNQVQAAEYEGFTYEVHDGKATITGCTLEFNYFMDIPATIEGYPVVSIGALLFETALI